MEPLEEEFLTIKYLKIQSYNCKVKERNERKLKMVDYSRVLKFSDRKCVERQKPEEG